MGITFGIITLILNSFILLMIVVLLILTKKNKKKKSVNAPKVTVIKNKSTKIEQKDKTTTSQKGFEYMWDNDTNSLIKITPETLEEWRYKMSSKTKEVFEKSKKGGK